MGNNYPKERKPRRTDYSKTYKLLKELGEDKLRDVLSSCGRYKASKILTDIAGWDVSPALAYYIRRFKLKLGVNFNER